MWFKIISSCLLAMLLMGKGLAQSAIKIQRLSEPIILDGVIDEPAWEEIAPFEMVQYEPVFLGEMSERTEVRAAYDDGYLYFSAKLFTQDPSTITANSLYRDRYSGDDVFAVVLDPFNDNQNGLRFFTNPAGTRFDQSISNDANRTGGDRPINDSWDTHWDVETTQTDKGWFVEMRIPFSSIGFQSNDGIAEMGLIVYRWLSQINERHIYPEIPPNWNEGNIKPSKAQDIILNDVDAPKPVYFTPYILGGFLQQNTNTPNESGTAFVYDEDFKNELGFDIKYNLTNNLTLDLTANTDFAQVESDEQQLNLTRFSLFFPEKRQFFQQRSSLFDFNYGDTRLFYSRKIGLDNQGKPVRIFGGARLTGRVGDLDIGFLNLQTASSPNLPSENFGVLRLKQRVLNPSSYTGGIVTSRIGADGKSNVLLGLDTDLNLYADDYLTFRVSQSFDTDVPESRRNNFEDNSIFRLAWERRASTGLLYQFFVNRTGQYFDPGIGFYKTRNTSDYFYSLGYGWRPGENSAFNQHSINIESNNILENDSFDLRSRSVSFRWNSRFKNSAFLWSSLNYKQEHLLPTEAFNLAGKIYIPVSNYDFFEGFFMYSSPRTKRLMSRVIFQYGQLFDGTRTQYKIEPRLVANVHLEISGSYQLTMLRFPEIEGRGQTEFDAHVGQLKGQFAFNKKISTSAFVQYSNVADLIGANFRFRYNFREGQDLWIVFDQTINTILDSSQFGSVELPRNENRSILIKYTHTFKI
ncbi:MAG: carbohydrate binding family 9 domain-containing protein [Gracilimonas sp.]|nr:carbohydrate binding family 9 domain-containing protein [Gracilimonas sp.]